MIVAFCGHSTYVENVKDEEEVLAVLESRVGELPCEFFSWRIRKLRPIWVWMRKKISKKASQCQIAFCDAVSL